MDNDLDWSLRPADELEQAQAAEENGLSWVERDGTKQWIRQASSPNANANANAHAEGQSTDDDAVYLEDGTMRDHPEEEEDRPREYSSPTAAAAAAAADDEYHNEPAPSVTELSVNDQSEEQALTEDIYSLMTTVGICTLSFWYAMWTFVAQAAVTCLVFFDLVVLFGKPPTTNGTTNRMLIPVDAPMTVTTAQFFGVALIVNFAAAQGDLLVGFSHLLRGYDPEIHKQNRHMSCFKWYMAGVLQFFVGAVLVADLAILLMQSTSNIMLCLNFAALHFVQDIDDVSFTVASMGLITRRVQRDCERIADIRIKKRMTRRLNIYRRIFLFGLMVGLYSFYFLVAGWQWSGRFMCQSVFVQFGDDWNKEWPHYSSVFTTPSTNMLDRTEGRAVYIDPTNTIKIAYCYGEGAWTISYLMDNHCDNYFIKSTPTYSFDIMDIAHREWFAQTDDLGEVPMDFLSVSCNDCNDALCSEEQGVCVDNKCVCNENRLGLNCEFWDDDEHLCEFMALDRRTKGDIGALSFASVFMRKTYRRLIVTREGYTIEDFYNRPFYISAYTPDRTKIETFIIFSGYRWIMFGLPQEVPRTLTITEFEDLLVETEANEQPLEALKRISRLPGFKALFFSGPTQYETRSHDVDPLTARWVLASISEKENKVTGAYADIDAPVSASFLCTKCDNETNPCLNDGVCGSPNVFATECDCNATGFKSYGGFMCEYAYGCDERKDLAKNGCLCDSIFKICTECDRGYYGNLCQFYREIEEVEVDAEGAAVILDGHFQCENSTCYNGGYCTNSVEACKCPDGWSGAFCENSLMKPFKCVNSTCFNGGVCNNSSDACLCPADYAGVICDIFVGSLSSPDADFIDTNASSVSNDTQVTLGDLDPAGDGLVEAKPSDEGANNTLDGIGESSTFAPAASNLVDQANCTKQTDCDSCTSTLLSDGTSSCSWFADSAQCSHLNCLLEETGACGVLQCEATAESAADRELCFAQLGCESCTSTLKSDGSRCQWYLDPGAGVEWCQTGGCDEAGVCGSETCAATEMEDSEIMLSTASTAPSGTEVEQPDAVSLLQQYGGGGF